LSGQDTLQCALTQATTLHVALNSKNVHNELRPLKAAGFGLLQFNAVPEWRTEYLDYSKLKKLSYAIESLVRQTIAPIAAILCHLYCLL
jgi:SPX domain